MLFKFHWLYQHRVSSYQFNQLAVSDEYTRHEEIAMFRATTSPVSDKKIKQSFRYNLILCYDNQAYRVFDEYTRRRLLFPTHFRCTFFKEVSKKYS